MRFSIPDSIEEAERRIYGTPELRGLIGDIADIEAQLADASKAEHLGDEYGPWRNKALKSCRLKADELRYLKHWIKKTRVERKIRDSTDGVGVGPTALLTKARDTIDRLLDRLDEDDGEAGKLIHAIDLYLQHIA